MPIEKALYESQTVFAMEVIADAIEFFTGTKARVITSEDELGLRYLILADGYRNGPCGG